MIAMAGNSFGTLFRITTFGESHGEMIGVVIDGCPAGITLDMQAMLHELERRKPGQSKVTTQRKEPDTPRIVSGVFEEITTGAPIAILFENVDTRSEHYEPIKDKYRPGHADFTYDQKYGHRDYRGGGRSSARETACRVAAGAIAKQILTQHGVSIIGFTRQIGDVRVEDSDIDLSVTESNSVRCPNMQKSAQMEQLVMKLRGEGDSIGGVVEVRAIGVPAGLGEPIYDKLSADIGKAMLSIPATKGVELGEGFGVAFMRGSQNNDLLRKDGFLSNHAGGTLGGISSGQELIVRVAIKPASSIAKSQQTIDTKGNEVDIQVDGRHDPCLCPRAVPVAEAMLALVLVDHLLRWKAYQ